VKAGHCTLAIIAFWAAGCATVKEPEPAAEAAPQAPPSRVVAKPVQIPKPVPPAQVAVVAPPPPATPEAPRPNETETLIAEFARLRKLGPAELGREQDAARQIFNQSRSDSARLRLGMTLALPGAPGSDDGRALDVLDPLVKTPGASLHGLAFMLASYVQEQRRLTSQLAGLQQNVQGLQQKLDAIKSLERSLSGRGEATSVRRR